MQTNLNWSKGLLSTTYVIYSNNNKIGYLHNSSFSQTSNCQLNGNSYTFRTSGIFCQKTDILDVDNKVIGTITFNNWMTKATINILNKTLNWKYDNTWNTKWSIFNDDGIQINYSGTSTGGSINSNTEDDIYLLCGLFVTNYYWQLTIVIMIAAFVPIYVSVLN